MLFRKEFPSLLMYSWFDYVGFVPFINHVRQVTQNVNLSPFVLYSLPDGLYCASYIFIMDSVWKTTNYVHRMTIVMFVPFLCIITEILQYIHVLKGTFDVKDLLCYTASIATYIVFIKSKF